MLELVLCRNFVDKVEIRHINRVIVTHTYYSLGFCYVYDLSSVFLLTIRKSVSAFLTINIPSASLAAVANPSVL